MNIIKNTAGLGLSFLMLCVIGVTSLLFYVISLLIWLFTSPFDKRRVILHRFTSYCLAFWVVIMPTWRIKVEGREKIRKDATYVIIANHQSQLDIMMTALLFCHFKWVSKAEVFKVPIVGWQMALNRYITIKRGYVNSIAKMMADCEQALQEGSSVLLFPEGTRSEDGNMKPLKPGAFILAEKQKLPILPVLIYGTKDALPKNSLVSLGVHKIRIKVLDELPYSEYAERDADTNSKKMFDVMSKQLKLIEKRTELGLF